MFAIISWTAKNGISLDQEQLEVLGSGKFVVMNGGLLEPEAAVSMLYKKEMWGGIIQSVHGIKILFNIFLKAVGSIKINMGGRGGGTLVLLCVFLTNRNY